MNRAGRSCWTCAFRQSGVCIGEQNGARTVCGLWRRGRRVRTVVRRTLRVGRALVGAVLLGVVFGVLVMLVVGLVAMVAAM